MESVTIADGVVILVLLVSGILAYARGFMRETLSIIGWGAAAVVGYIFAPQVVPLAKEIPYLNTLIEGCEPATITSFALVFAVALVIVSIFTPLLAGIVKRSFLSGIDQGLGFLFGIARGVVLILVAFIVYDRVMSDQALEVVDNSMTVKLIGDMSAQMSDVIPQEAPGWFEDTYETLIANSCNAPQ